MRIEGSESAFDCSEILVGPVLGDYAEDVLLRHQRPVEDLEFLKHGVGLLDAFLVMFELLSAEHKLLEKPAAPGGDLLLVLPQPSEDLAEAGLVNVGPAVAIVAVYDSADFQLVDRVLVLGDQAEAHKLAVCRYAFERNQVDE